MFRIVHAVNRPTKSAATNRLTSPRAPETQHPISAVGLVPGEFEHHEGLLVCWRDAISESGDSEQKRRINSDARQTVLDLIQQVRNSIQVVIVTRSAAERRDVIRALNAERIPLDSIRIVEAPFDTVWIRDYGPTSLRTPNGESKWVCTDFQAKSIRSRDKRTARRLAEQFGNRCVRAPFHIDGGNLLTNGEGLFITTTNTLERNKFLGYEQRDVDEFLHRFYGAKQIVYLEPMIGESNGHADMFATFTSHDTLVLGDYSREQDPVNRELLNRNAKRLRAINTSSGPLKIVRIPMPNRGKGEVFGGTYTNVVFANRVLIVPKFAAIDPEGLAKALATYRRLLPGMKVISLEASAWIGLGGSLHCLTKTVHRLEGNSPPREASTRTPSQDKAE